MRPITSTDLAAAFELFRARWPDKFKAPDERAVAVIFEGVEPQDLYPAAKDLVRNAKWPDLGKLREKAIEIRRSRESAKARPDVVARWKREAQLIFLGRLAKRFRKRGETDNAQYADEVAATIEQEREVSVDARAWMLDLWQQLVGIDSTSRTWAYRQERMQVGAHPLFDHESALDLTVEELDVKCDRILAETDAMLARMGRKREPRVVVEMIGSGIAKSLPRGDQMEFE